MPSVYVHAGVFAAWAAINLRWVGLRPFDPSFVVLALLASVEAIFLSTFILISQNRNRAVRIDVVLRSSRHADNSVKPISHEMRNVSMQPKKE